ncbi:hypothetical protein MNEG_14963, partial [Monoraphidium neglectum]
PSVSKKDQRVYEALRNKLRAVRGHLGGASGGGASAAVSAGDGGGGGGGAAGEGLEASDGARPMDTAAAGAGPGREEGMDGVDGPDAAADPMNE